MSLSGQTITFMSQGTQLEGYLARPQGEGTFPGVIVIHEIFGLNENIKEIAERFAENGYVAFAVDLFAGRNRAVCMYRVITDLFFAAPENSKGVRDLEAAMNVLTQQPGVDGEKLGAIGFCMGGSYAIAWACKDKRLRVIAPYYANNPKPLEAVARACPVVGSYPTGDFTTKPGHKLEEKLTEYKIPHDIKFYPGSKHSFFNDRGKTYDPKAAQDSWQRVTGFFSEHLGIKK